MAFIAPAASAPRGAMFNLIRRLHFYIGVFVAPFIFIAAFTGTLYVLTPQIENHLYQDALVIQPQGQAKPLSSQINAARQYAGEQAIIYAVRPAPGASDTTRVQFVSVGAGPAESRSVFVDPYSLQIKGDMTVYGSSGALPLRNWLDQLHRSLLLGVIGRNYSELAASWLWVAALGGVVLWLEGRPRRKVAKVTSRFAVTRHWHLLLGLTLLGGLLFFSVTGLTWSQWAGGNIASMRANLGWLTPQVNTSLAPDTPQTPPDPHAGHHAASNMVAMDGMEMNRPHHTSPAARASNRPDHDWDRVLQTAREAGISATRLELRQPPAADKTWTVTEVDRSWPTQVDAVSVDPATFTIVDHVWFAKFPLIARLTRWGIDAHMGLLFGLPNQLILAASGVGLCTMIVLGYRMWWIRRPAIAAVSPSRTLFASWLALPFTGRLGTLLIALGLGYCLPVMGLSLLLFLLIDILRWKRSSTAEQRNNTLTPAQQSPLSIVRSRMALRKQETRKFFRGVTMVAVLVGSIMAQAMISGVIEQYQIPFSAWSLQMYITQAFMIMLYTLVFTALLSVPLWYWFLGDNDQQ